MKRSRRSRKRQHTTDVLIDKTNPDATELVQYPKQPDEPRVKGEIKREDKGLWLEISLED